MKKPPDFETRITQLQRAHALRSRILQRQRALGRAEVARWQAQLTNERAQHAAERAELLRLREENTAVHLRLQATIGERDSLLTSKTWRYTEPLRRLYNRLSGYRQRRNRA